MPYVTIRSCNATSDLSSKSDRFSGLHSSNSGGGGETYHAILGGEAYYRVHSPKPKWDWSGLCPVPLRKITGREQTGGGTYQRWGGPEPFWGGVLWHVFPSPEFSTPLRFFRKILVSVKFLSAILGPEMGASILWTPGKMRS